jgi:hypothetical protein
LVTMGTEFGAFSRCRHVIAAYLSIIAPEDATGAVDGEDIGWRPRGIALRVEKCASHRSGSVVPASAGSDAIAEPYRKCRFSASQTQGMEPAQRDGALYM